MKKYFWFIALFTVSALAVGVPAQQTPAHAHPCEQDGAKFCPTTKTLHDFVVCMKKNKALLTTACAAQLDISVAAGKKMHKTCKADSEQICKATGPKAFQCMMKNLAKFSPACQKDVKAWKNAMTIVPGRLHNKAATKN